MGIENILNIDVCLAGPHVSWEIDTNKNINELLGEFYPKSLIFQL